MLHVQALFEACPSPSVFNALVDAVESARSHPRYGHDAWPVLEHTTPRPFQDWCMDGTLLGSRAAGGLQVCVGWMRAWVRAHGHVPRTSVVCNLCVHAQRCGQRCEF